MQKNFNTLVNWSISYKLLTSGEVLVVNILTAIKNTILIFSLTFSLAQADEPGYVLQNGSGVTDSSKQCVRTAASNPESVPAECSDVPCVSCLG